jgi:hypothetical protein
MKIFDTFFSRNGKKYFKSSMVLTQKRRKNNSGPANFPNIYSDSKSMFYRYLRDNIPLISASVWAWVRLCFTPQHYLIIGQESEKKKAEVIIEQFGKRVFEGISRKDGIKSLLEIFFLEIFTTGRFAGEIVPLASGKGISYFHTIDPFDITWERNGKWIPYIEKEGKKVSLDNGRFFYYGLGADIKNPAGVSPISAIPFVSEIEQKMLEDMSLFSHNAGVPRLHIKISPPEPMKGENEVNYAKRVNSYFDETVEKFKYLDPDDNIFTWSDVEISMVGSSGGDPFTWRLNREQVIEDVITGMRLFPWVVGRTHGTTKNWVQAQFNLLMQEVDSIQEEAKSFADWLRNTELQMAGINAKANHIFLPNQDPFILDKAKSEAILFDTVDKKVKRGYISKDDGAKELGYYRAFKQD